MQDLVVFGHGDTEDDGGHIFKTVNPLFPLGTLSADIEQLEVEILERKVNLNDASGFDASAQNVLFGWHVVFLSQTIQIVEETAQGKEIELDRNRGSEMTYYLAESLS